MQSRLLTRVFGTLVYRPAAPLLSRVLCAKHPKILMYHRCNFSNHPRALRASEFERHMCFIRQNCTVMDLNTLCALARNGDRIPPNTVVVTFDDGYRDAYPCVFPILQRYSIPATFYVVADFVDDKIWLWPDMLQYVLHQTSYPRFTVWLDGQKREYSLTATAGRHVAFNDIGDYCLTLPSKARATFITDWAKDLGVLVPSAPPVEYKSLSWDQIRHMLSSGISFGSHSTTHPILTKIESSEDLRHEIEYSKRRIEDMVGVEVSSFAYPNGQRSDYNDDIKAMLKASRYESAVTAFFATDILDDMYEIKRYGMGNDTDDSLEILSGVRHLLDAR